jgi:ligand-binding sensor domain-containing protein
VSMNFPPSTNRPGLPQIAYRIADYAKFRQALLDRLATQLSADPDRGGPLAQLTTRSPDDPAIALLDAWAVVGDVLTFYQERLINEAFLRTATERRSVVELARAIGYQLSPGVAASTDLAFMVEAGVATVPAGTQILSIPTGDELPQTFETLSPLEARADWNALKPRTTRPQQVTPDTQKLYLEGINLTLQPGDRLLLHDADPKQPQDYLLTLDTITVMPARGSTCVTWSQQLPVAIAATLRDPQVFAFQQQAGLFGQTAPRWENLANELKRSYGGTLRGGVARTADAGASWLVRSQGLPNGDVQCLAIDSRGCLFAGTLNGIWRSTDNGASWVAVNAGLINLNIQTLWINDADQILIGSTNGNVFRSKDHGDNWVLISQGTIRLKPDGSNPNRMEAVNTGLPNTVIHALVTYTPPLQTFSLTITSSKGTEVTLSAAAPTLKVGDTITAAGQSKTITKIGSITVQIPATPPSTTATSTTLTTLTIDNPFNLDLSANTPFFIGGTYLFAGTDEGVYRSQDDGKTWSPKGLPTRSVRAFLILSRVKLGQGPILTANNQVIVGDSTTFGGAGVGDRIVIGDRFFTVTQRQDLPISGSTRVLASLTLNPPPTEALVQSTFGLIPAIDVDLFAATDDGVFRSSDYGDTWTAVNTGLTNRDVSSLAAYTQFGQGTIASQGSTVTGIGTAFLTELRVGDPLLAADQVRIVTAIGSHQQLTLDRPFNLDLPADTTFAVRRNQILIAGTADGGFRSTDRGSNWTAINSAGLTQRSITCLTAYLQPGEGTMTVANTSVTGQDTAFKRELTVGDQIIVAGQTTTIAAISSDTSLTIATSINTSVSIPFQRLLLIAGTTQGVYRSTNPQQPWTAINTGLTSLGITAVAVTLKSGVGTIASTDTRITGTNTRFTTAFKVSDTLTVTGQTRTVTAIASDTDLTIDQPFSDDLLPGMTFHSHSLWASTKFKGFVEDEWPHFQLKAAAIDLDTLYPKILADSWLVLLADTPFGQQFHACQVAAIANAARQDFSLDLKMSRITPSAPVLRPHRFPLRETVVLAQSQAIALADELLTVTAQQHQIFADPVQPQQIWLSQFVTGLQREQALICSGKRMRATVNVGGFLRSVNWSPTRFTDPVLALAITDNGDWLAGTANGAYTSVDRGNTWLPIPTLPHLAVSVLIVDRSLGKGTLTSVDREIGLRRDRLGPPFPVGSTITATGQSRQIMSSTDRLKVDRPFTSAFTAAPFTILTDSNPAGRPGSGTISSNLDNNVDGTGTNFSAELQVGDRIQVGAETRTVRALVFTIDTPFSQDLFNAPFTVTLLWAGTAAGVFKSTNQGLSWLPVGSGLPAVQALAVHPSTGDVLAGTRRGVWLLTSSGQWTAIGLPHETVSALLIDATNSTLWAGTAHGLWRSQNNGQQWQQFTQTKEGTGTIASSGTQLRGQNTAFDQFVQVNDVIWAANQTRVVQSVESATALTLAAAFGPEVTAGSGYLVIRRRTRLVTVQDTIVTGADTIEFSVGDGIAVAGQVRQVRLVSGATLILDAPLRQDIVAPGVVYAIVRRGVGTLGAVAVQGNGTRFTTEFQQGDQLIVNGETRTVQTITNATELTIDAAFSTSLPTGTGFSATTGLTDPDVTSLVLTANHLVAGTAGGVFVSSDQGEHWQPRSTNLPDLKVRCLATIPNQQTPNQQIPEQQTLLVGTTTGGIARSINQGNLWLPLNVGLGNRQVNAIAIAALSPDLLAGTAGGLLSSTEWGDHRQSVQWSRSNQGLPHPIAHTLAVFAHAAGMTLWLGGVDGVFRSIDNGDTWQPARAGLTNFTVRSLALLEIDRQLQLFAGTPDGIFRSLDQGQTWQLANADLTHTDVQVLLAQHQQLWAGMRDGGVFRTLDQGATWTPSGLTNRNIRALTQNPESRTLFAGTANSGIWRSQDNGGFWTQLVTEKVGIGTITSAGPAVIGTDTTFINTLKVGSTITAADQVRTIAAIKSDTELTVTVAFRPDLPLGTTFSSSTGLTTPHITALMAEARPIAGNITVQGKVLTIRRSTVTFTVGSQIIVAGKTYIITEISTEPVLTISSDATFDLSSNAAQFSDELSDQLTSDVFGGIDSDNLSLSADQTAISLETTTLTSDPADPVCQTVLDRDLPTSLSSHTQFYQDYLFAGTDGSGILLSCDAGETWTSIVTQPDVVEKLLEIRCLASDRGDVLAGTARHGVWRGRLQPELGNQWIWSPLEPGLTNTEVRAIVTQHPTNILIAGIGILLSPDGFYATPVKPEDQLWITAPPVVDANTGTAQWSVVDRSDFAGIVTAPPEDISLAPAAAEDPTMSERVTIFAPPTDQALPILQFNHPLQNSYDPATVTIYGNIVAASHGATVQAILGSGDGTTPHQQFSLQKPPLTYTPAPTANGAASTLQVFVNDVRWQEAQSLFPLTALDSSYLVQIEDDGTTTVTFGDGQKGARLPSGLDNVTALYRSGIGLAGNVPADSLTLLKTRPLGIVEVTNPMAASGGADREDLTTARQQAPATVRTLDRIVSRQDFEDFARTFAGIGKAQAVALWAGETQLVHLSIVAANGDAVDPNSGLYRSLVAAMTAARDPSQLVQIDSAAAEQFNVAAKVLIDPRYQAEIVIPAIRDRLLTTFAFAARQYGQGVTAAAVIAVIQAIPGVVAVDLDALYRLGTAKALLDQLPAVVAHWDDTAQRVQPARLLLINPQGITLTPESAL